MGSARSIMRALDKVRTPEVVNACGQTREMIIETEVSLKKLEEELVSRRPN